MVSSCCSKASEISAAVLEPSFKTSIIAKRVLFASVEKN